MSTSYVLDEPMTSAVDRARQRLKHLDRWVESHADASDYRAAGYYFACATPDYFDNNITIDENNRLYIFLYYKTEPECLLREPVTILNGN